MPKFSIHFVHGTIQNQNKFLKSSIIIIIYFIIFNEYYNYIVYLKVKESRNKPGMSQRVPGGLGSQISWHSGHKGGEVVSLTHRPPLLIFTRGWVDPRAMVRSEENISLKNPVTPPGIDPGTVRLVAQRLNHYATPGPI